MNGSFVMDRLKAFVCETRQDMGMAAAGAGAERIRKILKEKSTANIMFAAAPSQLDLYRGLRQADVDWAKVNAFHMDNYLALSDDAPQQFSNYLTRHLYRRLNLNAIYLMGGQEKDVARYARLLEDNPIDICFMGIGENGHIAFNDPGEADFHDPLRVKKVALDDICRMQQVHDGCFAKLDDVPKYAITATVSQLFSSRHIVCSVPAITKAHAVKQMLEGGIDENCPASILRTHPSACLYLDREAASML